MNEAPGRREAWAVTALAALALALRGPGLERAQVWVDEAATWWFARLTASGDLAGQAALEPTPPLYYGLVGWILRLFGDSDAAMRWPSVLFGVAAVPLVYGLARRLFGASTGRGAGLAAALVLAVHPLHVFTSREARVYPLLTVLTLALLWALWDALDTDRGRSWVAVGALLTLACYSHFYGLFLGLTVGVLVLVFAPSTRVRLRGLAAAAAAGVLFAPYLAFTLPHLETSGAAWSVETFYRDQPGERSLLRVLEGQGIGALYHPYQRELARPTTPAAIRGSALAVQGFLLALILILSFSPATGADRGRRRAVAFLLVAWWVPILVPWAITHGGRAIFQAGRHDLFVLGVGTLLLGLGFDGLWRVAKGRLGPRLGWAVVAAALALVLGAATHRLAWLWTTPTTTGDRAAAAWLATSTEEGDVVVAMGIRRLVTERYLRLIGSDLRVISFPESTDHHPGWSDVMTLKDDQKALHGEAERRTSAWLAGDTNRIILLLRPYQRTETRVSATWLVDRHVIEHLLVAGWRRRPPSDVQAALDIAVFERPK